MDVDKLIEQLQADIERIKRAIACLEQLRGVPLSPYSLPTGQNRRGRKFMGPEERLEVSARMKQYWAGRKPKR